MKKAKFKMTGNGSRIEEVSESSCLCASVLKKDAGVVEGGFNTVTQRLRGTEFKMTEIGLIPEDWDVKRLGDVSSNFNYGVGAEAVPYIEGPRYIRITDIDENSHKFTPDQTVAAAFSDPNSIVNDGDILVARTGASVGKSYLYDKSDGDLIFAGFLMRFHPIEVISAYVYRQTLTGRYWQWIASESARSGQPGINIQQLKSFQIPVPPLPEQKKIAEALSDVDELLVAMTTLIEKKRAIKQGAMQELLGIRNFEAGAKKVPRRRLPGFSGEWIEKRLGECGSFLKGAGISRAQANSGRIPAVRYGELYTTHHEYIKAFESFISDDVARCSTRLTRGDIVFACSGETKEEIGKCAAFLGDEIAYAGGDLLILSPKEAYDSKFLAFELNTPFCASQKAAAGQGDAVVHIRQHSLEELIVCIPPTLAEQKAIAAVLSDIDAEIAALEAKRAKYESIKQGMMQELLTGKTRLKGV